MMSDKHRQDESTEEFQFPVFSSSNQILKLNLLSSSGNRPFKVSIRGERVIKSDEIDTERLINELNVSDIAEILKIKMYNESIGEKNVYDEIFGDRVDFIGHSSISRDLDLDSLLQIIKVKMYNESISDDEVHQRLFGDRLTNKTESNIE